MKIKNRELTNLGVPRGKPMKAAGQAVSKAIHAGLDKESIRSTVLAILDAPESQIDSPIFGEFARSLLKHKPDHEIFTPRPEPAPYRRWGNDMDEKTIQQMENACSLPVAVAGALMPDAHLGYGLPIGGVLAADNAVIPYAVGVDIACRMKMTILDMPLSALDDKEDPLRHALENETRFGVGAAFKQRRQHPVMDEDWTICPTTRDHKDQAWAQLGSSGSGNHFAEYGALTLEQPDLGLEAGQYLALLTHSGSRNTGLTLANHYSKLAMSLHPDMPKHLKHLAWLRLDSHEGQEYWRAMQLMGRYASANHELIHRHIARALGAEVLLDIENHHNFAWKETYLGRPVIVHRKGATPAGPGDVGIIPGSMATPGYIVRGQGHGASLHSASHGAGRAMSRSEAKKRFTPSDLKHLLEKRGVRLLSAGLDEIPLAYKEIDSVMAAQAELVAPIARFDPKLVKMAPEKGRRWK